MKLLQTITAGAGGQATFNFTSINQTYSDILLVVSARSDRASGLDQMNITFNGSATGYGNRQLLGFGSGAGYSETGGSTYVYNYGADGATATASTFGNTSLYISNYTSSNMKVISTQQVFETNATGGWQGLASSSWSGTAAINQITVSPNYGTVWVQGSTASLYGINPIPTASLGAPTAVDYLVVAGGGGSNQGGGGAGGMVTGTGLSVPSGTAITVTVGGGGSAGAGNGVTIGGNGGNSTFNTTTATGGGGGGAGSNAAGSGGSGGGGGQVGSGTSVAGTGITGQGYAGGTNGGYNAPGYPGGGGGGAGAVGGNGTSTTAAGNGGNGLISTINGFSTYYAGGGGGGMNTSGTPGNGGLGGGGVGAQNGAAATPGAANTGGGAGATGNGGAQGGSGIVIIRYPQTYTAPTATTGNPVVNYINGYRVYTWYNSGSITF